MPELESDWKHLRELSESELRKLIKEPLGKQEIDWSYCTAYYEADGTAIILYDEISGWRGMFNLVSTDEDVIKDLTKFLNKENITDNTYTMKKRGTWKKQYVIVISAHAELEKLVPKLVPYCHNERKRKRLLQVLALVENKEWRDRKTRKRIERIKKMYWEDGMTQKEIAVVLSMHQANVSHFMITHGIPTRTRHGEKRVE